MKVEYKFDFDGYDDFDKFLEKHSEVINAMDNSDRDLTQQMRYSVQANNQLPEHFIFNGKQYLYMMKKHKTGMQQLEQDNRVTVEKTVDDQDGDSESDGE